MMTEQEDLVQALEQVAGVMTDAINKEREQSADMIAEIKEAHKAEINQLEQYLEDAREHIKVLNADKEVLRIDKKRLNERLESLQKSYDDLRDIAGQAKTRLEDVAGNQRVLENEIAKKDKTITDQNEIIQKLQNEIAALRNAKSIRMPREFSGETEKTKEAKAERAQRTRNKIIHEIARYCAYPGFDGKVSMSWMITNTGFSDKTIRDCVKSINSQEIRNEGMHTWIIKGCSFKDVK